MLYLSNCFVFQYQRFRTALSRPHGRFRKSFGRDCYWSRLLAWLRTINYKMCYYRPLHNNSVNLPHVLSVRALYATTENITSN